MLSYPMPTAELPIKYSRFFRDLLLCRWLPIPSHVSREVTSIPSATRTHRLGTHLVGVTKKRVTETDANLAEVS